MTREHFEPPVGGAETIAPGQFLKRIRQVQGLTLRGVQQRTENKLHNGYLSQIETGRIERPGVLALGLIAETYGLDVRMVFGLYGINLYEGNPEMTPELGIIAGALGRLSDADKSLLTDFAIFLANRNSDES